MNFNEIYNIIENAVCLRCRTDKAMVTSPYRYLIHYIYMEAKKNSQRASKSMINSNTILLHIGNFETGKRTNLKRAVSECVYASRLYYNTEIQSDKELDWIRSFVEKNIYRAKDIEVIRNASPSDFVFKGFYNNGIGSWCNYLPIYEINGIEYVPMSQPYIIGRYE